MSDHDGETKRQGESTSAKSMEEFKREGADLSRRMDGAVKVASSLRQPTSHAVAASAVQRKRK